MWAAQIVRRAVLAGKLTNLKETFVPCADCGKRATNYDHRDYGKPLEVAMQCEARPCCFFRKRL